jgi:hypothetical protein
MASYCCLPHHLYQAFSRTPPPHIHPPHPPALLIRVRSSLPLFFVGSSTPVFSSGLGFFLDRSAYSKVTGTGFIEVWSISRTGSRPENQGDHG